MSYSFSVKKATKAEAKAAVAAEFDKVVTAQPVHTVDCSAVVAAASAFIDALADDPDKDVFLSCYGSVGWSGAWPASGAAPIIGASVSIGASLVAR